MDISSAEKHQIGVFRNFLHKNWKALALGLLIGIVTLTFWRYLQNDQDNSMLMASPSYQGISKFFENSKDINPQNISKAEKFIQKNHNNYAVFTALQLAKYFVEKQDFDKAEQQLISALPNTKDNHLLSLIYLRLAHVQLQLRQLDQALKSLDNIRSENWLAMAENVRGDILLEKNDITGARAAYNKSIELSGSSSQLLRLKLNNLSG